VTAPSSDAQIFVGIGPATDVGTYLSGVAHDEIIGLADGGTPTYRTAAGATTAGPPTEQTFWATAASGTGTQELSWSPTNGQWAVVIMNADGSAGVSAVATVEVMAGFLLPLALTLLILGMVLTTGAVVLIVIGASGGSDNRPTETAFARPKTGATAA